MTREEAIQILERRRFYSNYGAGLNEALDMAIESLSADTVSRSQYQGLLNAIGKVYVEVVQCKDCRHAGQIQVPNQVYCRRDHFRSYVRDDDDFCKYGERREQCD